MTEAFERLDDALQSGGAAELIPIPTGFEPLDRVLGGGLRPGELMLVGGIPGVGKTIATLQWARNIASQGKTTIFACYEHEEVDLLVRLLALEMGELSDTGNPEVERLRARIQEAANGTRQGLAKVLDTEALSRRAHERLERYSDRLWLLAASGAHTGLTQLEEALAQRKGAPAVLFVDYLQKVAVRPEPPDEAEKVTTIAEGLKELALAYKIPIVCVVAADLEGLKARRLRLHHLRGSSA
ncbi:MAG: DnaB-like helicase C-terminal domain-containing protein, partial [Actinomycetota bacterium]